MIVKKEWIAMLLAGGQGSRLYALTRDIAKPAVPFGGKYRIIDFPLSNCVNSGIDTVGVLTQYQPLQLNEYLGNGQPWDLDRIHGGVYVLPPYQKIANSDWYTGTANAIYQHIYFITRYATRVWVLENGVITDYPMGFARYRQVKALEAQNKIDHTPKAVKEKTVTEKPKPNRSAQQARRQLTICEKEISAQETAIAEIEQRLEEAGGDYERYSEIYKEKEAAEQKLSELMEKWETLAEQAGE